MQALVLTGGSARGAFMAGVVRGLIAEHGLNPDVIAGVSIGGVIGAALAQAPRGDASALLTEADRLLDLWRGVPERAPWWRLLTARQRAARVRETLHDIDPDAVRASGRAWYGGAVDLRSGRWVCARETDLTRRHLEGIVALPGALPPVPIGDQLWVDGVVRRIAPVSEVLQTPADEIIIVTGGAPELPTWSGGSVLRRCLTLLLHEAVFTKDIRLALDHNPGLTVRLFTPRQPLPAEWRFDARALTTAIDHGLAVGAAAIETDPEPFRW